MSALPEPVVWTVPQVARLLNVSRSTAYVWAQTGAIPALHIGTQWFVPKEALANFLRSCDPCASAPTTDTNQEMEQ